jgi:HlyD family secretion protein
VRRDRFWLVVSLGVAAVSLVVGYFAWPGGRDPEYVTAPVERGSIVAAVKATGAVNPVTSVQVGTYVSGPILEIYADFNSKVAKGERIAKIDPRTFSMKVDMAAANLADAEARVARAQADLDLKHAQLIRQQSLAQSRVASLNDLDVARSAAEQAEADLKLARATVAQAAAALSEARINLGYTEIVSPVDGIVVSRNVDVGQTVAASFQTPTLFVIAEDLTKMQVNAQVSEADIGMVREGQIATFTVDAYPGRAFPASVKQVRNSPLTVQSVVTYDVVLNVDNREGLLKPGMTASVDIVTARAEDVLKVPTAALRFKPPTPDDEADDASGTARAYPSGGGEATKPRPTVYRLVHGEPVAAAVTTGLADETTTEVKSADLEPGERVILRLKPAAQQNATIPGMGPSRRRP